MPNYWREDEDALLLRTLDGGFDLYYQSGGVRTYDSWQKRRLLLQTPAPSRVQYEGVPSWRDMAKLSTEMQEMRQALAPDRTHYHHTIETEWPIVVMVLGDTHIGSWSTDYDLLVRITDEILSIPNLYLILVGDLAHMAIKMRSVEEVSDNLWPPGVQPAFVAGWLDELTPRILATVWGNHDVQREEELAGGSRLAELYRRVAPVYFGGIGHLDLSVGSQLYHIAASHRFRSTSKANPCAGPQSYLVSQGIDRDIAIAGDSHLPGILKFTHGPEEKVAINCGSIQTMSPYARRHFSIKTHATFPCFTLNPHQKLVTPYWSLQEWLAR